MVLCKIPVANLMELSWWHINTIYGVQVLFINSGIWKRIYNTRKKGFRFCSLTRDFLKLKGVISYDIYIQKLVSVIITFCISGINLSATSFKPINTWLYIWSFSYFSVLEGISYTNARLLSAMAFWILWKECKKMRFWLLSKVQLLSRLLSKAIQLIIAKFGP